MSIVVVMVQYSVLFIDGSSMNGVPPGITVIWRTGS